MDDTITEDARKPAQTIGLIAGPAAAALLLLLFDMDPARPETGRTAAIVILMAVWWMTEAVPLWVTALLPVFLFPFFGIMSGKNVSALYYNHIIFLFLGGFMVALAMERWNLHKRIALKILLQFGANPKGILLGFMVATGFISMWVSNTASAMMMIPIVMAVISKLEESCGKSETRAYSAGLLLGIAYSASIGGIATLVGSPPNPVFARIFSISFPNGPEITFAGWFAFAFPISAVFLLIVWAYLAIMFKPGASFRVDPKGFKSEYESLGAMTYEEKVVSVIFGTLAILWLTRADIVFSSLTVPGWGNLFPNPGFITDGTTAVAMAVILFLIPSKSRPGTRVADWRMVERLPWGIILLFGGGFALAQGFKDSGLSAWLGNQLSVLDVLHPVAIVSAICFVCTFLTELTSNTATAQIILPILASLSVAIKVNPILIMLPATIAQSFAFMLPVGTPPNAIVFGAGRLTVWDMAKAGFALNILSIILLTLAAFLLAPMVFGLDLASFPEWGEPAR